MVWECRRVARPLSSGVKVGRASSQPDGSLPVRMDSSSSASCKSQAPDQPDAAAARGTSLHPTQTHGLRRHIQVSRSAVSTASPCMALAKVHSCWPQSSCKMDGRLPRLGAATETSLLKSQLPRMGVS